MVGGPFDRKPLPWGGMCFPIVLTRRARRQPRTPGADSLTLRVGSTVSGRLEGLVEAWWFVFSFGAGRGGSERGRVFGAGLIGV